MKIEQPTLFLRDRFAFKEWICPECRKLNLSRVAYDTGYVVQCKGRLCKAIWVVGHTLRRYTLKGKRAPWPPDLVLKAAWEDGQPVNEVLPSQLAGNRHDEPGGTNET